VVLPAAASGAVGWCATVGLLELAKKRETLLIGIAVLIAVIVATLLPAGLYARYRRRSVLGLCFATLVCIVIEWPLLTIAVAAAYVVITGDSLYD
jgi:hypothetical protein